MDDLAEDRMLHRAVRWFQATPLELVGLVVLLSGALVASAALWWSATARPMTLPSEATAVGTPGDVEGDAAAPPPAPPPGTPTDPPDASDGSAASDAPDPSSPTSPGEAAATDPGPAQVTVHVTGAVASPGLVVLDGGARVGDAVAASGGLADDAAQELVNLARPLADGEHVHVPRIGEEPPPILDGASPDATSADPADGELVDLNTASVELLQTLPGIGPEKADAIARHRESEGPFQVPGDLRAVPGIGEATFQQLAELIAVG